MYEEKRGIPTAGRRGGKEGIKGMGKEGKANCGKKDVKSVRRRKMLAEGKE